MRPEIPTRFGERDIRDRVGEASFERGEGYFAAGALFDLRREGRALKARCEGSGAEVYLVRAAFDLRGLAETRCSCPVGDNGRCKHVAALLLTWARAPEEFLPVEPLDDALARCDREELVALLRELVAHKPETEATIQTLLAPPAPPPSFRAMSGAAFRHRGEGADDAAAMAHELETTVARAGENALRAGEPGRAVGAFAAVIHAVLARYTRIEDPGGALRAVVERCVDRVAVCLASLAPVDGAAARDAALEALFAVLRADVERRMVGAAERVARAVARDEVGAEDRRALAGYVRRAMDRSEEWSRKRYERLRVDLESDALSHEAFLALCRATGRTADLLRRLVEMDRDEEAVREAEFASDDDLARLGANSEGSGLEPRVEKLVAARARVAPTPKALAWLRDRRDARGDAAGALGYAEQLFRAAPDLAGYHALRERAERAGAWDAARERARAVVRERGGLLAVEVALAEKDLAGAIAAAQGELGRAPGALAARVRVADAAERAHPREAVALYRLAIEALVRARGRANYREALRLLRKVRALYARLGEGSAAAQYETELRARYGELPAFSEEMDAALAAPHQPRAE